MTLNATAPVFYQKIRRNLQFLFTQKKVPLLTLSILVIKKNNALSDYLAWSDYGSSKFILNIKIINLPVLVPQFFATGANVVRKDPLNSAARVYVARLANKMLPSWIRPTSNREAE